MHVALRRRGGPCSEGGRILELGILTSRAESRSRTLALSMIGGGLLAWMANLGGQIRHTEIRSGVGSPSQTEKDKRGRAGRDSEKEHEEQ